MCTALIMKSCIHFEMATPEIKNLLQSAVNNIVIIV